MPTSYSYYLLVILLYSKNKRQFFTRIDLKSNIKLPLKKKQNLAKTQYRFHLNDTVNVFIGFRFLKGFHRPAIVCVNTEYIINTKVFILLCRILF